MRNVSSIILSLVLGSSFAAQAETAEKIELGLNDVSVLLPYNEQPKLYEVAPTIDGFVSREILLTIDKALSDDSPNTDELSVFFRRGERQFFTYRMVSFRVDPCANIISVKKDLTACRPEFRVVWQRHDKGRTQFEDNNIHAIHVLTKTEFQGVVDTLRKLKSGSPIDTQALPLSPNPVIAQEGLESPYYLGMMDLVKTYARPNNLKEVAFLAETSQGGHWPMLKLEVNGEDAKAIVIPGTEKDEDGNALFVQRMDGRSELDEPFPIGNAAHNLFRSRDNDAKTVKNAFAIEKPSLHSPAETDCASCHRAELERSFILERNPGLDIPKDVFTSRRWNLTNVSGRRQSQSLQVFSYFVRDVRIMPRTINETAVVADFINANY